MSLLQSWFQLGRPNFRSCQRSDMCNRYLDGLKPLYPKENCSLFWHQNPSRHTLRFIGNRQHLRSSRWVYNQKLKSCLVISDNKFILFTFPDKGIFIPFFYIVEYAKFLSISDDMAFYILAVMNAGGLLGRIAPAYLADKVGRFNLLVPSAFLSGLSCLVFWFFAKSLVAVMMFSVVYGFLSGSFVSVINPCVAQISHMSQMGTRIGLLYSIISIPWVFIHSFISLSLFFLFSQRTPFLPRAPSFLPYSKGLL